MSDDVLSKIEATVMTKTKEAILKHCDTMGLSIGEVIDHLVIIMSIEDPKKAATLLSEEFVITIANQTEDQVKETVKHIAAILIGSIVKCGVDEDDFLDEILDCIHEENQDADFL